MGVHAYGCGVGGGSSHHVEGKPPGHAVNQCLPPSVLLVPEQRHDRGAHGSAFPAQTPSAPIPPLVNVTQAGFTSPEETTVLKTQGTGSKEAEPDDCPRPSHRASSLSSPGSLGRQVGARGEGTAWRRNAPDAAPMLTCAEKWPGLGKSPGSLEGADRGTQHPPRARMRVREGMPQTRQCCDPISWVLRASP